VRESVLTAITVGFILLAIAASVFVGCDAESSKPAPAGSEAEQSARGPEVARETTPNVAALVGWWVRTDSPYVIDVASALDDGRLEVSYLNPRPINVSRAEYQESGGTLEMYVELQDAGYPGSNYELTYDLESDVLRGVYNHEGLRQTFDVLFVRQPTE
jgi:hypothetical protein